MPDPLPDPHGLPRDTAALRLRRFVADDAAPIMALNGEASTARWLPSHVYPTLEHAASALGYLIDCYADPGDPRRAPYVLAVEHLATGRLLGHVGFSPFDDEIEVSYAIAESWRGRGHGTEALAEACRWIAAAFGVTRLLALTAAANLDSARLLGRAGFVHRQDETMVFQGREERVGRYIRQATHPQREAGSRGDAQPPR